MAYKTFEDWLAQVPESITQDPLWDFETYRKSLFLSDLAWHDSEKLLADQRGKSTAWQMIASAGSIAANIEEGYGRGFGKDYARFLRMSHGSARETRGWYYHGRHVLEPEVVKHRMEVANEIIASLIITADQQRRR